MFFRFTCQCGENRSYHQFLNEAVLDHTFDGASISLVFTAQCHCGRKTQAISKIDAEVTVHPGQSRGGSEAPGQAKTGPEEGDGRTAEVGA